ncbi:MAG TPA: ribosome small subunit-dependent GTPase A [Egicoccus sp.]|nr:ribosome small subunit-dependent GTPase A [Egicoccus sp.]HSK24524.1 ribosome small subunit-dependent GTPase A [Egicoccus sp.]
MDSLRAIGYAPRWEALFAAYEPSAEPGRVVRHDGVSLQVRTSTGVRRVPLRRGLPPLAVGDWIAVDDERVVALLDRFSLLRRRAAGSDDEQQLLAANVDLVLLVAGLDRPVTAGRIRRGEALAFDAGAQPVLVLTKADLADDLDDLRARLAFDHPWLEVLVTSSVTEDGLDELRSRMVGATSVLVGESGAGKSALVNALTETDAAGVGAVRHGDHKGRHTTTSRQLHELPGGGVVIDSPGIREIGLAGDDASVEATFGDIGALAAGCRFGDCRHAGEPGCAVVLAVESGELAAERLAGFHELRAETAAAARRADEHERRAHERQFTKQVRAFVRSDRHNKR